MVQRTWIWVGHKRQAWMTIDMKRYPYVVYMHCYGSGLKENSPQFHETAKYQQLQMI